MCINRGMDEEVVYIYTMKYCSTIKNEWNCAICRDAWHICHTLSQRVWHHWLNGHEFEKTQGDGKQQGSLACCSSWGCKESDTVKWLNNNKAILAEFPRWLSSKESTCNAGDMGLISGLGRSPGEGNGNPLQYSCLGNPMDRGAWRAIIHGVAKTI